jgi:prepilin-type N-terminal cleavage/methylation domain-containing protein
LHRRGLSLLELLICIAIIAVLLGVLLPSLSGARSVANRTLCANNLRQIGIGWSLYIQDNGDRLPRHDESPAWKYGGVEFAGAERLPILTQSRPINRYIEEQSDVREQSVASQMFRCPSDRGVSTRGTSRAGQPGPSVLANGNCWNEFGNSYRANHFLVDAATTDSTPRALRLYEITATHSKLLLTGDAAWYYATLPPKDPDSRLEATWHGSQDAGNMLSLDGSVRFTDFADAASFSLQPK